MATATETTKANGTKTTGAARVVVRLGAEAEKTCRQYAKREAITVGEAADQLIDVGRRRLKALKRWNDKPADEKAAAPAKKTTKKAAKTKASKKGEKGVTLKNGPSAARDDSEE